MPKNIAQKLKNKQRNVDPSEEKNRTFLLFLKKKGWNGMVL